jgi:thiazole synthase
MEDKIEIVLNGEKTKVSANFSLLDLLSEMRLNPAQVAVEVNRTIVRRSAWAEFRLSERDVVEIVHFVGGGNLPWAIH